MIKFGRLWIGMGCYYEQLFNHWPFFPVLAGSIPLKKSFYTLLYSFILLCSKCITIHVGPTCVVTLDVNYKMIKQNNYNQSGKQNCINYKHGC